MYLKGPALIVFSMFCIGAAGLVQQVQKYQGMSQDLSQTIASSGCMDFGFDTPEGRVGCLTPVILDLEHGIPSQSVFK